MNIDTTARSDLDALTALNRDYIHSVQHGDVRRFEEILAEDAVRQRLTAAGVVVEGSTPEAFGRFMAAEFARWNAVREAAGIEQK